MCTYVCTYSYTYARLLLTPLVAAAVIGSIVEFEDLQRLSGFERRADVERWAEDIGLPFRRSRSGIWTTLDALNSALGVLPTPPASPYGVQVI